MGEIEMYGSYGNIMLRHHFAVGAFFHFVEFHFPRQPVVGFIARVHAFVEILPGTDGLVHISQICERRIKKVSDEIHEGDEIVVKVIDVDRNGKVKLSRKEAMRDEAAAATTAPATS